MADDPPCCAPARPVAPAAPAAGATAAGGGRGGGSLVDLAGGAFRMGADDGVGYPGDGEAPVRSVTLSPYRISPTAVTNAEFAAFVDATGQVTDSERFGWSFVFAGLLPDDFPDTRGVVGAEWWRQVYGADWRHPRGRTAISQTATITRSST